MAIASSGLIGLNLRKQLVLFAPPVSLTISLLTCERARFCHKTGYSSSVLFSSDSPLMRQATWHSLTSMRGQEHTILSQLTPRRCMGQQFRAGLPPGECKRGERSGLNGEWE